jgi:hypothetical protein
MNYYLLTTSPYLNLSQCSIHKLVKALYFLFHLGDRHEFNSIESVPISLEQLTLFAKSPRSPNPLSSVLRNAGYEANCWDISLHSVNTFSFVELRTFCSPDRVIFADKSGDKES